MKNLSIILSFFFISFCSCQEESTSSIFFPEDILIDTIPFSSDRLSNIISMEVSINKKSYNFIFDSGSSNTFINASIPAKRISSDSVYYYDLFNQSRSSIQVSIDTLQIGRVKIINMDSYCQRELNLDGILGNDIIDGLVWKFDLFNRQLYVTENISSFNGLKKGIPFKSKGKIITVACEINGKQIDLIIDTGYSGFISLNKDSADSLSIYEKEPVFWEGISTLHTAHFSNSYIPHIDSTYYLTGEVRISESLLQNEIIELYNNSYNIIGMDFFKRFDYFILDYPNQMLYLGEEQEKSLDFLVSSVMRLNSKGVTVIRPNSNAQIGRVTRWAKEMGLHYLDTILSIDGISLVNRDKDFYKSESIWHEEIKYYEYFPSQFLQVYNNFHFQKDTSVIEVKRGNGSKKLTLIRKYLFTEMPDSIQDYYLNLNLPKHKFGKVKTASSGYYTFKTSELLPPGLRK